MSSSYMRALFLLIKLNICPPHLKKGTALGAHVCDSHSARRKGGAGGGAGCMVRGQ